MALSERILDLYNAVGVAVEYGVLAREVAGIYIKHPALIRPVMCLNYEVLSDAQMHRRVLAQGMGSHLENRKSLFVAVYYRNNTLKSTSYM